MAVGALQITAQFAFLPGRQLARARQPDTPFSPLTGQLESPVGQSLADLLSLVQEQVRAEIQAQQGRAFVGASTVENVQAASDLLPSTMATPPQPTAGTAS